MTTEEIKAECQSCASLADRVSALEARQQELLQTIVRISQETPLVEEVKEALNQRGTLIAEIGTLRAEVAALRRRIGDFR